MSRELLARAWQAGAGPGDGPWWGHVRQLDRVSRELLARAWQAGAGPGDGPLTIDMDSTICETYGLAKEGARHHGYTGKRGYHPLLAVAAGTGDVLMARLREGRANTARGAAHFLRETVGRVRYAGANGRLTLRADSGFYTHGVVSVCRKMDVRYSITIRQHKSLHNLIEAIPEDAWTPIPYWMDGVAQVEALPDELGQAEVPRQGAAPGWPEGAARHWPPSGGRRRRYGYGRGGCQHLLGAPFQGSVFCYEAERSSGR